MADISSNSDAGRRLRAARERLGLSTREVERLSRALAESKQNQEYYISHAWLSQIERGELTPGIFKIYTLSTIYQHRLDEVLGFFGMEIGNLGREQIRQPIPRTHLLGTGNPAEEIGLSKLEGGPLEKTDLVSRIFAGLDRFRDGLFPQGAGRTLVYGYVGTKDFTLFPLIRPGSFVEIDSAQRRIQSTRWGSEFERPIYFVELRDEYACSWCEEKDGRLFLIPSPQSGCRVREVRYPAQADIVGRVTAVTMRIAESKEKSASSFVRS